MPIIRSGYSCPTCKRKTGDINEVVADGGKLSCSKHPEHRWDDSSDFLDAQPDIDFKQAQERPKSQSNHTSLSVSIPVNTANRLLEMFGDRMDVTVAGVLNTIAEGEVMMVGETDLKRIGGALKERPKNAGHLFGLLFALTEQIEELRLIAENAQKEVKAYEGISPGRVVVNLADLLEPARQRAQNEEPPLPLGLWLERQIRTAIENNWW